MEGKIEESFKRTRRNRTIRKKKRIIIAIIIAAILIALIIRTIVLINNNKDSLFISKNEKAVRNAITGRWTTDGNTVYECDETGKGALIVPVATLPFSYKVEDDKIFIDIENEDSEDATYTYEIIENKLILVNEIGTFEFYRMEE